MEDSIDSTFGAALMGLVLGSCLYGVTVLQTFTYFRNYGDDSKLIKSLVVTLTQALADTLHLILCTRTIYWYEEYSISSGVAVTWPSRYLITNFGDADNLDRITWSMALQTDFNGIIGLIVEAFFARRVWKMSRNWIVTGVILALAALHFGLGVVFTAQSFILGHFSKFKRLTWVTCIGLGAAAAADIIIAIAMCYYLYKKRTGLKRTDSIVTTLMVYSINTGLTTSVIGTIIVIAFGAMPTNFIWLGFFWIMGKCYVNSFLALLNSRESLRDKVSKAALQLNNVGNNRSFQNSFTVSGQQPKHSPLSGVAVQVETVTEYSSPYTRHQTYRSGAGVERMSTIKDVDELSTSSDSPDAK
ncbi:hypothetical protein C8Q79DRAFT_1008154 [Trametes meyenii]|nr:hypothetical protein C8Q79DRAFT_1008154 [Trametes meyenii]